ncbi:LOW QUALITY PROTEIN: transmembrane protein 145-like [Pecten maximus]|uniref:LOW QUALITY PROTEIN: transmembrane protein 145-like n=1 Tax=Pecten maximus TaxID=6579 RepID=UPI001458D320|nr:LOW QUALITY PROTEIN: transmembrane protein 145-like [Pecten maximus]
MSGWMFLALLPLLWHQTLGKRVEGTLITGQNWEFLTRFCFLSQKGILRYQFEYPKSYAIQSVLLYFDEASQWDSVYKTGLSCDQKVAALDPANNQIIALSILYSWSGCKENTRNGVEYITCIGGRTFRSTRERWWFVAISRCDQTSGPTGMNLTYSLHMMNSKDDKDMLHYEFSADEFYILPTDIAFMGVYVLLLVGAIICAIMLKSRQLFHTTYKLYILSVSLWLINLFFLSVANGKYSADGYENNQLELAGRVFGALSDLVFLLMLILVGKGYTITRGRLPASSTIKVTVFFTLYTIVYAVLFVYEAEVFDPGEVLYLYESPPGYGLISLRLIGWAWFCYSIFFTLKHFKTKSLFYYPFFIFYTVWFWAGPIVILVAMFAMAQWMREKTVHGVSMLISFLGHVFFQLLTRPSAANKNFPYHVRTTQIASMTGTNSHELDNFNAHSYAVGNARSSVSGPDLTSLFTTSKTTSEKGDDDDIPAMTSGQKRGSLPPSYSSANLEVLPGIRSNTSSASLGGATGGMSSPPSYHTLFTANSGNGWE